MPSKEIPDDFALPDDLVLLCMRFLDVKSFINFSQTCSRIFSLAQNRSLCLNLCREDPTAKALIEAAGIEIKLQSGEINPYAFLFSFVNRDFLTLNSLVGTVNLWTPSYELRTPKLFRPPANSPRLLYLTQMAAKKETPNASKVKSWLVAEVTIDIAGLEILVANHKLPYSKAIDDAKVMKPEVMRAAV